ncbi:putative tail sheath protein [Dickeya phage vB_DsoM_JA29]|uniref:Putative tail sheath protein n=1 Tax=Dickeya phage vB_DsoM_JA29 TaxID=2283031 RepID=A0A384ZX85_9CAUD|nr:putative tail sheath protein [Dickeya phage vB_DsoM_JA29]AXG66852.1 putative tail sheath protein [Dickeya phage vB_DsoM_JA29]
MLLPDHPSAGTYTMENDRSGSSTLVTNGYCTLVLPFPKGEIGKNITITSKDEIETKLGSPTGRYAINVLIAKILMTKARRLNVTRVALNAKYGGVFATMFNNLATLRPVSDAGFEDPDQVAFRSEDIGLFYSLSQYDEANDIWISFQPDTNDPLGIKALIRVYIGNNLTPVESHTVTNFYWRDDAGNQFFIEDVINNNSNYIRFRLNEDNYKLLDDPKFVLFNAIGGGPYDPTNPTAINGQFVGATSGDIIDVDHSDQTIANNSLAAIVEGWDNYQDWEQIACGILCSGGIEHPVIANKINELSQTRMDCISTVGIPVTMQARDNAVAYRRGIKTYQGAEFTITDSWTAICNSDVKARDTANARDFYVPASVCMAYCMLNTDQIASWLAPGGLNRGNIDFATDVRHRFKLNDRDVLVENQINPIAVFEGEGIFLWGADTAMTTRSALNDIGVRRLLAMLHASARANNLRAVFEPNDDILKQAQITGMESILEPIRLGRGLDWYEVVCDYTNNSTQDEARGDLIIDIFLDPTRYTKRIHVTAIVPPVGDIQYAIDLINRGAI